MSKTTKQMPRSRFPSPWIGARRLPFQNVALSSGILFVLALGFVPILLLIAFVFGIIDLRGTPHTSARHLIAVVFDESSRKSLIRSCGYAFAATTCQGALAILLSLPLYRPRSSQPLLLYLFILPLSIAPIAASLMWKALLDYQSGPINTALERVGIQRLPWLGTSPLRYPPALNGFSELNWGQFSLLLTDSWLWVPFLLGGLLLAYSRVPVRFPEAASLEGATHNQIFWRVTLPLALPYVLFLIFLRFVDSYRTFDASWAYFGSSSVSTHVTPRIYTIGYLTRDYASAAGLALVSTLLATPVILLVTKTAKSILTQIRNAETA